jgi:hypothetical protein
MDLDKEEEKEVAKSKGKDGKNDRKIVKAARKTVEGK